MTYETTICSWYEIQRNEDGDYYTGGHNQDVWNRYMAISDKQVLLHEKNLYLQQEYATNSSTILTGLEWILLKYLI